MNPCCWQTRAIRDHKRTLNHGPTLASYIRTHSTFATSYAKHLAKRILCSAQMAHESTTEGSAFFRIGKTQKKDISGRVVPLLFALKVKNRLTTHKILAYVFRIH